MTALSGTKKRTKSGKRVIIADFRAKIQIDFTNEARNTEFI